ncbi:Coenzyme F420 hydrogenase/dehydrogenase, beta subunit C-terminal domain [Thioclava electrotropha]|uniref:4Fe-4S ferredoxin-type domain-containing protein n=1 Tax=Thioclava electrotropha TaxID=1549850 RepID=A0ABX6YVL4_9RHOB|nr:Coenzyme F420 hydrogenase/dehydrogenase, beta subunit C-terminal domain [Thioclava electrotropha]QPZ91820.1 hypothetical protein AKL02_013570 [Thioclava electrotropha]
MTHHSPISTPSSEALAHVAAGDLCAGCGLCAGVAPQEIAMAPDARGFLRPVQSAEISARAETAIAACCPGLGQSAQRVAPGEEPLWGRFMEMKSGHATDADLRHAGASGGALSALALHLLQSGRVDAIAQIEPDPDNPIGNRMRLSTTRDEVLGAAGSRYAPSAPLADLSSLIADGRRFAVIGKPCDAVALRALVARDPKLARSFPVILSFFCAGVPSAEGARELLAEMGAPEDQLTAFRYRGNGWPGKTVAALHDGSTRVTSYHAAWGGVLSRHIQHRCKICADGTGVAADLVCADAWEADDAGYPLFEEAPGHSLIVARTRLGAEILREAEAAEAVETAPFDVAELAAIQPGQRERRRALFARLAALKLMARPIPRYEGMNLRACALQNPVTRNLRNFAGTVRRVLRGRK